MDTRELFFIALIVAAGLAAIAARWYFAKYQESVSDGPPEPVTAKTSTVAFVFGVLALLAMLGKPSTLPVANSIMLALIAVIFVFAISEKLQNR